MIMVYVLILAHDAINLFKQISHYIATIPKVVGSQRTAQTQCAAAPG